MKIKKIVLASLIASAISVPLHASAGSSTASFNVQLTVTAACTINASPLNFGSTGLVPAAINQQSSLNVVCSNTVPYQVGLDAGNTSGSTVSNRLMSNGTATVPFALYSDAGHTSNWGNTQNTDTYSATGNGTAQVIPVYGVVPALGTAPAPGSYSTSIVATVYF